MISYSDQRRNLRAARTEPALVVLDVTDPRVLAVLGRDDSPAEKLAALAVVGEPATHERNEWRPGGVTRWYSVEVVDGGAVA